MPNNHLQNIENEGPTRIAFCITDLDAGGAEWALYHIVTRLDKSLWAPHVYCLSPPGELVPKLEEHGIPVTCYGAKNPRDLRVFSWLTKELRKFQPVIVQGFLFHGNIVSRIAGYRAGVPIRIAGHRVAEREKKWHLRVDRLTKRFVQHHVCVSDGVADFVTTKLKLKPEAVSVIHNGIDPNQKADSPNRLRGELGLDPKTEIILAVGRLHEQKGFHFLLEAFAEVAANWPLVHLVIAGEGPERQNLEAQVRSLGLEQRVTLAGYRCDVPELMAEADLFVLSSIWEGMPNVVLQAMLSGVPVIATSVEGVAELIQDGQTGRIIKPADSNELRKAMEELLADLALRLQLANCAQHIVVNEFTIDEMVQGYGSLYQNLLQASAGS